MAVRNLKKIYPGDVYVFGTDFMFVSLIISATQQEIKLLTVSEHNESEITTIQLSDENDDSTSYFYFSSMMIRDGVCKKRPYGETWTK